MSAAERRLLLTIACVLRRRLTEPHTYSAADAERDLAEALEPFAAELEDA